MKGGITNGWSFWRLSDGRNPRYTQSSKLCRKGYWTTCEASRSPRGEPKVVLDVLQRLAAQALTRSERMSSRGRQAFALAAGFFAVVQTVAFTGFGESMVSADERRVLMTLAIVAGAALLVCGVAAIVTDSAWKTDEMHSDEVLETAHNLRGRRPHQVHGSGRNKHPR
jgi:hypothetical protein